MSSGSLEVTLVSASISSFIPFENEPCDTYAILRCSKEQHSTKNARDQGRVPVWNETFIFDLQEQDMSNELFIQVFNVRTEVDELLGVARIPIHTMLGKEEATLCALISQTQRDIGKIKAAWKWKPGSQRFLKASSFEKKTSEVEAYSKSESYAAEPFDADLPYKSMKSTSYKWTESGMQGYSDGERYTAGAAATYDSKLPQYGGDSGMVAYPHVSNPSKMSSERFSKLDAVADSLAKLSVDKEGSGRPMPSYLEDSCKASKESKVQGGDYCHEPTAPFLGAYPTEPPGHTGYLDIRASDERKGELGTYSSSAIQARGPSDHTYPPPPTNVFPSHKDGYPPHSGNTYPPPPDAFPPNKHPYSTQSGSAYPPRPPPTMDAFPPNEHTYQTQSGAAYPPPPPPPPLTDAFPQDKDRYPPDPSAQYPPACADVFPQSKGGYPPYSGLTYPPPPSDAYPPAGAYHLDKESYPPYPSSRYPPYPDHQNMSSSDVHGEGLPSMERGAGIKEKGGNKKDKEKGHGSHATYGQPPSPGYQYPQTPQGYPPAPQGYPPAPHGYPPVPHGYPPAPHGYPSAPHGYPSTPQGYPPYGYPPASQHVTPYGYPTSTHGGHSGHYPDKHGHAAAGAYVGHSSSSSKPSKQHKEPKHSSSHKHHKHKKQKSFKGLKFKKFKF